MLCVAEEQESPLSDPDLLLSRLAELEERERYGYGDVGDVGDEEDEEWRECDDDLRLAGTWE